MEIVKHFLEINIGEKIVINFPDKRKTIFTVESINFEDLSAICIFDSQLDLNQLNGVIDYNLISSNLKTIEIYPNKKLEFTVIF